MDFVEYIRVSQKRAEARIGTQQDRPAAIFSARKVRGVSIAEDPPAEGDEFTRP